MSVTYRNIIILCALFLLFMLSCQSPNHKTALDYLEAAQINLDQKNYQEAVENCTKSITLDPANPEAWNSRAYAYYFLLDFNKAIADYTETLRLEPEMGVAWVFRAQCYTQIGEHEKAAADMETITNLIEAQKALNPIINHE